MAYKSGPCPSSYTNPKKYTAARPSARSFRPFSSVPYFLHTNNTAFFLRYKTQKSHAPESVFQQYPAILCPDEYSHKFSSFPPPVKYGHFPLCCMLMNAGCCAAYRKEDIRIPPGCLRSNSWQPAAITQRSPSGNITSAVVFAGTIMV